jgi:hypothetical protein
MRLRPECFATRDVGQASNLLAQPGGFLNGPAPVAGPQRSTWMLGTHRGLPLVPAEADRRSVAPRRRSTARLPPP